MLSLCFRKRTTLKAYNALATLQQYVLYLAGCTDLAFTAGFLRIWHECPRPEVQDKDGVSLPAEDLMLCTTTTARANRLGDRTPV